MKSLPWILLLLATLYGLRECLKKEPFIALPYDIINEAVLYKLGDTDEPYVHLGIPPEGVLDSLPIYSPFLKELYGIIQRPHSDATSFLGCFRPEFIVYFRGGYHNYVGHITVSLECEQIKYTDNQGYHILTEEQVVDLSNWYSEVSKPYLETTY